MFKLCLGYIPAEYRCYKLLELCGGYLCAVCGFELHELLSGYLPNQYRIIKLLCMRSRYFCSNHRFIDVIQLFGLRIRQLRDLWCQFVQQLQLGYFFVYWFK